MRVDADPAVNLDRAESAVREAAAAGAQIIQLPELFTHPYFPKDEDPSFFEWARSIEDSPAVERMTGLAAELDVVLPVSLFERANQGFFNTIAVIDAGGAVLGHYRKSHIPNGPGYKERFYFSPGDTGFRVWTTRYGRVGVGICWDQWFPETARAMALAGAEVLFYPSAIGSEPLDPELDSLLFAVAVGGYQGDHVGAGVSLHDPLPVVTGSSCTVNFYGSSFIAGPTGEIVATAPRDQDSVLIASFDLDEIGSHRRSWGLFRARRPELYGALVDLDGTGSGGGGLP
jgi:N-carbamoylputrescine amidase